MRILVTLPTPLREDLLTDNQVERLKSLGNVKWNTSGEQFDERKIKKYIYNQDVCVTGWGSPTLTKTVLDEANELELVTHIGGTIAPIGSDELFNRDIPICSAISEMAPFVAEGVLAMTLSALRELPQHDAALKRGEWSHKDEAHATLFNASIGFVGLGTVGDELLSLLEPFDVEVSIYDPYITDERLESCEFAKRTSLENTLRGADVVSIHAAKTHETLGMIDSERLAQLPDGALLVNAARGAIVEQDALIDELQTGRITAALDVFEPEPLPTHSDLRDMENVLLVPHQAGSPSRLRIAEAMIEEIDRYLSEEPLKHRISRERFQLMTNEEL